MDKQKHLICSIILILLMYSDVQVANGKIGGIHKVTCERTAWLHIHKMIR